MRQRRRGRKRSGVVARRGKLRVYVRVAGHLYTTTMPADTPDSKCEEWKELQRTLHGDPDAGPNSFAADIKAYMLKVSAMPTAKQKQHHLDCWARELGGTRSRHSIASDEIEIILNRWRGGDYTTPDPKGGAPLPGMPLSEGSLRKRRANLYVFFTKLNTKQGANPVRGVPCPPEAKPEARYMDWVAIDAAIAAMPTTRPNGTGRSLSPLRARVVATTGIPPGMLAQVRPWHLVLTGGRGSVRVLARKKGGGIATRTVKLSAKGLAAFIAFDAGNAYGVISKKHPLGYFAVNSLNTSFKRGVKKSGGDPRAVHLYDLRHSFLTEVYKRTRDEATVQRLGLHVPGSRMTARYTVAAHEEVDEAALDAVDAGYRMQEDKAAARAAAAATSGFAPANEAAEPEARRARVAKLPAKVTRGRKVKRVRVLRAG